MIDWLPPAASAHARETDALLIAMVVVGAAVLALVFGLIWVYGIRYRAGRPPAPTPAAGKSWHVEVAWTAATLAAFVGLFLWGADLFVRLARPPADALVVRVTARQWMWRIEHPDGQREIDELHVPVGRPVALAMVSEDVIHSFFVPALRIKADVVPGRVITLWFLADRTGSFPLFCAEYCGTDHAAMGGRVVVMAEDHYAAWLGRALPGASP